MLQVGTTLGPYEILARLGAGGMGEVYKARDTRLDRVVAIKILPERFASDPAARARFEREARAISHLNDPHICTLYDVGRETPSSSGAGGEAEHGAAPTNFLVMEYLEGRTLAERLERGPLPLVEVLRYGRGIAHALDRAHRAGIVHRDLKPANIMLVGGTRQAPAQIKLMDFGLARGFDPQSAGQLALMEVATMSRPVTAEGTIVGTLNYMAPEQLEAGETDVRTDVWALGCVLYEMATGKRPFEGTSQASLVAAIMEREPEPLARVQPLSPPALEHVVSRCLAKSPGERWQSARDVAHELEWLARADTFLSPPPAKAPARRRFASALGLLFLLGTVAAGFFVAGRAMVPQASTPKYTRLTFERGRISGARFKGPGAANVLFSAEWEGRPPALFQTQADGLTPPTPLNRTGMSLLAVAADNEVALLEPMGTPGFGEAGRLLHLPSSGGAPFPRYAGDVRSADYSQGKDVALVKHVAGEDRLEMPPGGTPMYRTPGILTGLRVSPDGRRVAMFEHPMMDDARGRLVLIDRATNTRLASGEFADTRGRPNWSADGREVWFSAAKAGEKNRLYAVPAAELSERARMRTFDFPLRAILHDISPDGRKLVAFERHEAGLRLGSGGAEVGPSGGWFDFTLPAALSADGRAFLSFDSGDNGGPDYTVWLSHPDGASIGEPRRLGSGFAQALSDDGAFALTIRQDRLVLIPTNATATGEDRELRAAGFHSYQAARFVDSRRILFVAAKEGGRRQTWLQDIPDGQPRAVTDQGTVGTVTDPGGRLLAALSPDGRLVIVPLDGGAPKDLGRVEKGETICQWSADGSTLYLYQAEARLDVAAVEIRTGLRRPWRTFQLPDPAGALFFNFVMTRDARTYAYGYIRRLNDLFVVEGLK